MEEFVPIAVFVTVLFVLVLLFSFRPRKKDATAKENFKDKPFQRHTKKYTLQSKHAAVTIGHEPDACEAVKELGQTRFLVRSAPILPLKECTQSNNCHCQYLHHSDRRKATRRDETVESNQRKAQQRNSENTE